MMSKESRDEYRSYLGRRAMLCVGVILIFFGAMLIAYVLMPSGFDGETGDANASVTTGTVNTSPAIEYNKTAEWNESASYVADVLETDEKTGAAVLEEINRLSKENGCPTIYFLNLFEKVEGSTDIYHVISGDCAVDVNMRVNIDDGDIAVIWLE